MKIQDQVCTLAQSKRLVKLGVSNNSYFSWFGSEERRLMDNCVDGITYGEWVYVDTTEPANSFEESYRRDTETTRPIAPAFNVAELGIMIEWNHVMHSGPFRDNHNFYYHTPEKEFTGSNEAIVRADVLIYLLENNLTTPSEVNQRINS